MNEVKFDLSKWNSLILVNVEVQQGENAIEVVLALDTGCTQTVLRPSILSFLGLSANDALRKIGITTGTRTDVALEFQLYSLTSFGFNCQNMKIVSKELPKGLFIDGLLGLDFFKLIRKKLLIDFDSFVLQID